MNLNPDRAAGLPVFTSLDWVEAAIAVDPGFKAEAGVVTTSVASEDLMPCLELGVGIQLDPGGAEVRLSDEALSVLLPSAAGYPLSPGARSTCRKRETPV